MQTKSRVTFKPIRELYLNLTNTETQEQSVKSLYFDKTSRYDTFLRRHSWNKNGYEYRPLSPFFSFRRFTFMSRQYSAEAPSRVARHDARVSGFKHGTIDARISSRRPVSLQGRRRPSGLYRHTDRIGATRDDFVSRIVPHVACECECQRECECECVRASANVCARVRMW